MSKKLKVEDIRKLAKLAQLELSDDEVERFASEMGDIVEYFEQLKKINVDGLKPTLHVSGLANIMRADTAQEHEIDPKELVAAAPRSHNGYIQVGRMI